MGWMSQPVGEEGSERISKRVWAIALLLLFASAINYMDRQTLAASSVRVTAEFEMTEEQYGRVEAIFANTFAIGSLFFGILVDSISVRWLYPAALFAWSLTGFATGWVEGYPQLLWCRGALGFFEAAHWPCALKTTQLLLQARGRALGNSVLQSGTSIGAILTPIVMWWIMVQMGLSWRVGFQGVGLVGLVWIAAWLSITRAADFQSPSSPSDSIGDQKEAGRDRIGLWNELTDPILIRRFLVILVAVSMINTSWQLVRAWLPKVLQNQVGYSETQTLWFNSLWFACTDVGCIGSGFLAYWLARRGWSVRGSRVSVFALCALATASLALFPWIQRQPLLMPLVFLIGGAGLLGVFPLYYSFSQDISRHRMGLVTGVAGAMGWMISSRFQVLFGRWADLDGSYSRGMVMAALLPLVAMIAFAWFWPEDDSVVSKERSSDG